MWLIELTKFEIIPFPTYFHTFENYTGILQRIVFIYALEYFKELYPIIYVIDSYLHYELWKIYHVLIIYKQDTIKLTHPDYF